MPGLTRALRSHIRNKRRLAFNTFQTWVRPLACALCTVRADLARARVQTAWEDMARQYRYVLAAAVLLGFVVLGLFAGSACSRGGGAPRGQKYYVTGAAPQPKKQQHGAAPSKADKAKAKAKGE